MLISKKLLFAAANACICIVLWASHVSCQTGRFSLSEVIDSSSLIILGKVDSEYELSGFSIDSVSKPGYYGIDTDLDGYIYRIKIQQVLKGDLSISTLDIFVKYDETIPAEGPGVSLSPKKVYLLFLNPRSADSAITLKYSLSKGDYYFPYLAGYGATLLEGKDALDELKRTEDYLSSHPPAPSINVPVTILLDSLAIKTKIAFDNGSLGDQNFLKELDKKLENAKKQLAKADSLKCFLAVQNYQKEIDFVYEKTLKKEIKGKDAQKRFVTVEGWSLLYNYAQYILDKLRPGREGVKK